MIELLSYQFMQYALIAGVLIGFISSYFGVLVVQRRMSFLGAGLSHSAFGGVALGLMLGVEPLYIAAPFTVLIALLIPIIKDKTKLATDTSIGILFAMSMALGILFISLKNDYTTDAFNYLFGSILAINQGDIIMAVMLVIVVIITMFRYWSRWAYATFDIELAESDKLNTKSDDYVLSLLIALTIVISIKLIGIILISAFLVIPPASARMLSKTFYSMTKLSIIFGIFSSIAGLILSFYLDIPSGASIILLQVIIFIISFSVNKIFDLDL